MSFSRNIYGSIQTNVHINVDSVPMHSDKKSHVECMSEFTLEKGHINVQNVVGPLLKEVIGKSMKNLAMAKAFISQQMEKDTIEIKIITLPMLLFLIIDPMLLENISTKLMISVARLVGNISLHGTSLK